MLFAKSKHQGQTDIAESNNADFCAMRADLTQKIFFDVQVALTFSSPFASKNAIWPPRSARMYNHFTMSLPNKLACLVLFVLLGSAAGYAQSADPAMPTDEVIRRFAEKEKQFKLARANYVYRQEVKVEELTASDRVTGVWQETADIGFDSAGRRTEK